MSSFIQHIDHFFDTAWSQDIELYNEISLQLELGIFLRSECTGRKVQFERPTDYFGITDLLEKREIDIAIFSSDKRRKTAIELKFPQSGQYPEQMFAACRDIAFLEQLVREGFDESLFVMLIGDRLYYSGKAEGIYRFFRGNAPLRGRIVKPTGPRDSHVSLQGSYSIFWKPFGDTMKYCAVSVSP